MAEMTLTITLEIDGKTFSRTISPATMAALQSDSWAPVVVARLSDIVDEATAWAKGREHE